MSLLTFIETKPGCYRQCNRYQYSACGLGYTTQPDSKPCSQALSKQKINGGVKWSW